MYNNIITSRVTCATVHGDDARKRKMTRLVPTHLVNDVKRVRESEKGREPTENHKETIVAISSRWRHLYWNR